MTDKTFRVTVLLLLVLIVVAQVVGALAGRARRHDILATQAEICVKHNDGLSVLHDVIVLAMVPPKGKTLTSAQVASIAAFEGKAFARIDLARC